jgi:hypothetical protein
LETVTLHLIAKPLISVYNRVRKKADVVFLYANPGPVVLFLHGFPENWYSWRKQMSVFSASGFRAVAPDLRGYGATDSPQGLEKYTYLHIVGDLIGLLDSLQCEKVCQNEKKRKTGKVLLFELWYGRMKRNEGKQEKCCYLSSGMVVNYHSSSRK